MGHQETFTDGGKFVISEKIVVHPEILTIDAKLLPEGSPVEHQGTHAVGTNTCGILESACISPGSSVPNSVHVLGFQSPRRTKAVKEPNSSVKEKNPALTATTGQSTLPPLQPRKPLLTITI